jgi:hypothetical protein
MTAKFSNQDKEVVGQVHNIGAVFGVAPDGEQFVGRLDLGGMIHNQYAEVIGRAADNGGIFLHRYLHTTGMVRRWSKDRKESPYVDQQVAGGAALVLMLWRDELRSFPGPALIR